MKIFLVISYMNSKLDIMDSIKAMLVALASTLPGKAS